MWNIAQPPARGRFSKIILGVLVLAALAGASRLELAGQPVGDWVGHLLIAPADARRARPPQFGFDGRRPEPPPVPALLPPAPPPQGTAPTLPRLPQGSAFAPPAQPPAFRPAVPPPAFGPGMAPPPRRPWKGLRPPAEAMRKPHGFSAHSKLPRPDALKDGPRDGQRDGPRDGLSDGQGEKTSRSAPDVPGPRGGRPGPDPAAAGPWHVVVRDVNGVPGMARPSDRPLPVQLPLPLHGMVHPASRPHLPLHRLMQRLAHRRPPQPAALVASRPRPGTAATTPGKLAAGSSRGRVRLGARPPLGALLPPIGSFRSDEVLAINLSPEGLAKARASNYQVTGRTELPEFGLTLTHLRPPEGVNAVSGRDQLFDLLPEAGFTLNRVYAPYRPGSGEGGGLSAPAQSGKGCAAERCFGTTLIKWQPRLATCARDVKVGIVDTGFDKGHPAFEGVRYDYREFLPEGSVRASAQHGTGVLALLAGNAESGTPGLIPDASYVIANAFFADPSGQPISDTAQMIRALHWLRANNVAVVNLSFAGPEDDLVHHAVQELTRAGAVVIAAAGNEGPGAPPSYPAAYQEVIAVTAVDRNLAAYRYANRGDHIDVAAPGVDVWTALPGRREGPQTGTSFAVPYVTAVVAVALPEAGLLPDDDALAAKRRALARLHGNVKSLGAGGRDPVFGEGLIQAPATCKPPALTVAAGAPAQAEPWAGTVRRAADADTLVVGSWISTVRAVAGEDMRR